MGQYGDNLVMKVFWLIILVSLYTREKIQKKKTKWFANTFCCDDFHMAHNPWSIQRRLVVISLFFRIDFRLIVASSINTNVLPLSLLWVVFCILQPVEVASLRPYAVSETRLCGNGPSVKAHLLVVRGGGMLMLDMLALDFVIVVLHHLPNNLPNTLAKLKTETISKGQRWATGPRWFFFPNVSPGTHDWCIPSLQDTYPVGHMFSLMSFCCLC